MNDRAEILEEIREMDPWFHNLHLPGGIQTAPGHFLGDFPNFKWQQLKAHIPRDLAGCRVLDIGCNAGFYTFELARRGATVTGIDLDPHYLRQAEWAAEKYGLKDRVSFKNMQVYDLAGISGKFDIVWFMGLLYHLRYFMLALDIVTQKAGKLLVLQTLTMPGKDIRQVPADIPLDDRSEMLEPGWPRAAFIEHRLAGDPTNWWALDHACVEAVLRSCGMKITATPSDEIYLAEPDPVHPAAIDTWNRSEYLSATGKGWKEAMTRKLS